MELVISRVGLDDPDARRLVEEVQGEYVVRYGGPDDTPLDVDVFDPPRGAFFVGRVGGPGSGVDVSQAVVSGAWRMRDDLEVLGSRAVAEVKRMYVVPAARGAGHARAMLAHLEATAAAAGAEVVALETGAAQPEAIALYLSSGYEPVPGFGHYAWSPSSRYYARRVVRSVISDGRPGGACGDPSTQRRDGS